MSRWRVVAVLGLALLLGVAAIGCDDDGDDGASNGGGASGGGGDDGSRVTLTVEVTGPGSVEFFDNQNQKFVCPTRCEAEFVRGSEADLQRELGLAPEVEGRSRLKRWGGDCPAVDAGAEPRGGHCVVLMDQDRSVTVTFVERPRLRVTMTGANVTARYELSYEPEQLSGNNFAARGVINCRVLPDCGVNDEVVGFYDPGTTVRVEVGSGFEPFFVGFDGACEAAALVCEITMTGDVDVVLRWDEREA